MARAEFKSILRGGPGRQLLLAVVTLAATLMTVHVKVRAIGWRWEFPRLSLHEPVRALFTVAEDSRRIAQARAPQFFPTEDCELCSETEVARAFDALLDEGARYRATGRRRVGGPRWREEVQAARLVALAGWGDQPRLDELRGANVGTFPDYVLQRAGELVSGDDRPELQRIADARRIPPSAWLRNALMLFALGTLAAIALGFHYRRRPARSRLQAPGFWRGLVVFIWANGFRSACTLLRWDSPEGALSFLVTLPSIVPALVVPMLLYGTRSTRDEAPVRALLRCPEDRHSRRVQLVFALAVSGGLLAFWRIGWPLLNRIGLAPLWTEGFNEVLRFGTTDAAAMRVFSNVVLAPFGEELLYRGALFGALRTRLSLHRAALLSALIFAAVHGYGVLGSLFVALSGYVWARLAARTGSLWPTMLSHALVNAVIDLALLSRR